MGKKGKKGGGGGGGGDRQPGEAGASNQPEQQRQPQPQQQRPQPQQQQQRPQQQQQQRPQQPQQQQRPQQQQQQWPQQQQQQRPQQSQQWPQPQQQQQRPQEQQQRPQQSQQWPQPQQQQQRPQEQQQRSQPQQQQQQDASQDFPLPGAGDFTSKKNKKKGGRQGQAVQQQESGPGPSTQPLQQPLPQSQPAPQQQYPQQPRMQQPPGIAVAPVRQAGPPPFTSPQAMEQQGPPRQPWGQQQQQQQQQARFPAPRGRGQAPWGQRGPPPQQVSQPQSRETTPTQQQPVSPMTSGPPMRQQPAEQPPTRPPPSQPPPQQQPHQQQPPQQRPPQQQPPQQQPPQQRPPQQQPPQQQPPQPTSPPAGSALAEKMKKLDVKGSTFLPPKRGARPQDPKKGREIVVETNHLNLNIKNKNMVIHHYDVSINPEKPYRNYRQAVEAVRQRCFRNRFPAFDGKKNLYSYPELPILKSELVETVTIYDNERDQEKEMTVTIKYATQVNVSMIWDYLRSGTSTNAPQEAIQALDIVLRQPAANRFVTVGRSFFSPPPGRVIDLGYGLDLWYGFFQSAIIGWKPFLNIDVAHKGFPAAQNCVLALTKFIRGDVEDPHLQLRPYELETFVSYIKGLKVAYEIPSKSVKRTYKVNNITTCPRDNRFQVTDKDTNNTSETTVERYFFTQYNLKLKYPHLPCLTVGSQEKPLALPMELCTIVEGQVTMKKMNETQTRTMVKEAAVDTERRKSKIVQSIRQINFNRDPCLKEFGLSVDDQFTKVKARIMNAPTLDYREKPVTVRQGVWRNEKFISGAELVQWRIVNTNPGVREPDLRKLATDLINHGRDCGMNISTNYRIVSKNTPRDLEQYFSQCLKEDVKLVIVVLPDRGMTYASIKKIAEIQVGVLTQCLKSITVQRRLNAATFVNILQKINAKLNGVNHHVTNSYWPDFFKKPVIVVGADVTHPAPDQQGVPSIAAVAASHDPKAFRYNMIWKLQPPREEVIRDLESIMKEQLMMFYRKTSHKPQAILFYRDGVSEGQFKIILNQELMAIRRACSSLSAEYKPPITFIVVQKRHHTRFFPDQKDADGRNKNVPAGTVVDTEITHPTELDFYLVSHASIQGTARPTKYHLLWDDSNLSEQNLEEITYYLCHLFTRCTRSVSYPAPTYYAHLAAFRARAYTDMDRLQLNQLQEEQNRRTVKDSVCKSNPMFFV